MLLLLWSKLGRNSFSFKMIESLPNFITRQTNTQNEFLESNPSYAFFALYTECSRYNWVQKGAISNEHFRKLQTQKNRFRQNLLSFENV